MTERTYHRSKGNFSATLDLHLNDSAIATEGNF